MDSWVNFLWLYPSEAFSLSKPKTFVREATGLVREIGMLESILNNLNCTAPLASIIITSWWIFVGVPGGDPIVASALGLFFNLFGSVMAYALVSASFPRTAAPYVAQTRVLAPWIGWPTEVCYWLGWIMFLPQLPTTFFLYFSLIPGLYAMGVSSGNASLIGMVNWLIADVTPQVVIATVFTVFIAWLAIIGTKRLVRDFQVPVMVVHFLCLFLMIGIFASSTREQFVALTPKYLGNTFQGILDAGATLPTMVPISYGIYPILASASFFTGQNNTFNNAYVSGEMKRGGLVRTQILSMVIPTLVQFIVPLLAWIAVYGVVGREFLIALVNASYIGSEVIKAPLVWSGPVIPYIGMMLADNFWLQLLLLIGASTISLAWLPITWVIVTREMFAWSFDRLLPAKFSQVSERFHTPIWTIVFTLIVSEILILVYVYTPQYLGAYWTISWVISVFPFAVTDLAAALLPARKHLWEQSPVKKWKVAGIPVISIFGIIGAVYVLWASYVVMSIPAFGYGLPAATYTLELVLVPFVLYWVIRAIRKRQGIDIDLIFRELPPE